VLRKPVAPAPAAAEVEAAAATADHVTVTSRDLRRQRTPPARDDDTDHHADEQQQQHRQEHHCSNRRRHRHRNDRDDESARSSSEEEDSSVFADTLTSPQSVYSDARDEPDDIMVVNGGETFGGSTGRTAAATHQAFTIVKHRKVELNPAKLQSAIANGKSLLLTISYDIIFLYYMPIPPTPATTATTHYTFEIGPFISH